jgi:hypothetical protein
MLGCALASTSSPCSASTTSTSAGAVNSTLVGSIRIDAETTMRDAR